MWVDRAEISLKIKEPLVNQATVIHAVFLKHGETEQGLTRCFTNHKFAVKKFVLEVSIASNYYTNRSMLHLHKIDLILKL